MNKTIVYYSKNGSSKAIAEMIAEKTKANIYEIIDLTKRGGLIVFIKSGFQARMGKRVKIGPVPPELLKDADEVFVVFPIWASKPVPAIRSFLDQSDLKDKLIQVITCQSSPKLENYREAASEIKDIAEAKGAKYNGSQAFAGSNPFREPDLELLKKQVEDKNWKHS